MTYCFILNFGPRLDWFAVSQPGDVILSFFTKCLIYFVIEVTRFCGHPYCITVIDQRHGSFASSTSFDSCAPTRQRMYIKLWSLYKYFTIYLFYTFNWLVTDYYQSIASTYREEICFQTLLLLFNVLTTGTKEPLFRLSLRLWLGH